jgi:rare lipoprotein A
MTSASLAALLVAAGCSSQPYRGGSADNRYGVAASPRVVADGEPIPPGGGRFQVGKPYQVAGKTYVPREDAAYDKAGVASWYGSDFHGRLTANGEIYDKTTISAAHRTMPLPSYARVTNLANGKSIIVRVNDRGPFAGNREIDLSERVSELLEFKGRGLTQVRVQYVGRAGLAGSDQKQLLASLSDGTPSPAADRILVARADLPASTGARPTLVADLGALVPKLPSFEAPQPKPVVTAMAPERPAAAPAGLRGAVEDPYLVEASYPKPAPRGKPASSVAEILARDLPPADGPPMNLLAPELLQPVPLRSRATPLVEPSVYRTLTPPDPRTTRSSFLPVSPSASAAAADAIFAKLERPDAGIAAAASAGAERDAALVAVDVGPVAAAEARRFGALLEAFGPVTARPFPGGVALRVEVEARGTAALLAFARDAGIGAEARAAAGAVKRP